MGDKDTGDADPADHLPQPGAQFQADLGVDRREGLVEQQDLRVRSQGPRKGDTLALSARELAGIPFFQSLASDQPEEFLHFLPDLLLRRLLHPKAESDILKNRHIAEKGVALKNKSDPPLTAGDIIDDFAVDQDLTGIRMLQAGNHSQDGRLAAAGGAQQGNQFSSGDTDIDIFRCLKVSEVFIDIAEFNISVFLIHFFFSSRSVSIYVYPVPFFRCVRGKCGGSGQ